MCTDQLVTLQWLLVVLCACATVLTVGFTFKLTLNFIEECVRHFHNWRKK